jgi:hypothetical protein
MKSHQRKQLGMRIDDPTQARVKSVRLLRRRIRGKPRCYVPLINEGKPLRKARHPLGAGRIIRTTTMRMGVSSRASGNGIDRPDTDERSSRSQPIARACMGSWSMRSWGWGMLYCLRPYRIEASRSSMAAV